MMNLGASMVARRVQQPENTAWAAVKFVGAVVATVVIGILLVWGAAGVAG